MIDYSQCKNHAASQFTFKTRSFEEKDAWQKSLMKSLIEGFGNKLSENEKKRMTEMSFQNELSQKDKSTSHGNMN